MKKVLLAKLAFCLFAAFIGVMSNFTLAPFSNQVQTTSKHPFNACKKMERKENTTGLLANKPELKKSALEGRSHVSELTAVKDKSTTDLFIGRMIELPNNQKRRELLQVIQQWDDEQQEIAIYYLMNSERELDQETATGLVFNLNNDSVRLRAARELLQSNINEDVKLMLSFELNTILPSNALDLAISTYYETKSIKIRTALIDSIFSSHSAQSVPLDELLFILRSAQSNSVTQQIKPLLDWLEFGHSFLNESQKESIVVFSDDMFFGTNDLETKEVALLLRQMVTPED